MRRWGKLQFEYDELLKRYEALQRENNVLRNENSELHEALERYYVEFFNDIRRAEREIIIFSPKINENRIGELIKCFYTNLKSGVTISFVLPKEIKDRKVKMRELKAEQKN